MRPVWARVLRIAPWAVVSFALFLATAVPVAQPQASASASSEIVLTVDPAQSKVHWSVDSTLHMVHGTFALKSGNIHFDPETGAGGGEVVVIASSGESGNTSRDKRMHKEILETAKYPEAVFCPKQIEGKVAKTGTSDVKLVGVFSIHGKDHDLTTQVHAELMGGRWTGTGEFEVPYVKWGIKDPSNFLLKVAPVVKVELELSGEVAGAR
jgi:polyisoprenoid-binding protein YceI